MKINVEVDISPEEMRRLIGLPDLQPFWEAAQTRIAEGDSEVITQLVKSGLTESFKSMDTLSKFISNVNVFKRGGVDPKAAEQASAEAKPRPKRARKPRSTKAGAKNSDDV